MGSVWCECRKAQVHLPKMKTCSGRSRITKCVKDEKILCYRYCFLIHTSFFSFYFFNCVFSITIYPFIPLVLPLSHRALSVSLSPISFFLNPCTPQTPHIVFRSASQCVAGCSHRGDESRAFPAGSCPRWAVSGAGAEGQAGRGALARLQE